MAVTPVTRCPCRPGTVHVACPRHGPAAPYRPRVVLGDPPPVVLRLPFTTPPLTTNEGRNGTGHWSGRAKAKKTVQDAVVAVGRAARVPAYHRVRVLLTWYAPDKGTRDPDGLSEMLKAVMDALTPPRPAVAAGTPTKAGGRRKKAQQAKTGLGIIPDDSARFVDLVAMRIVLDSPDPHIALRIEPA